MSALPAGGYTSHAMATAGVNCVTPDTGDQYGYRDRVIVLVFPPPSELIVFAGTRFGASTLPAGVYTAHAMTVGGVNCVTPDVGMQYGAYYAPFAVVLRYSVTLQTFEGLAHPTVTLFLRPAPLHFEGLAHPTVFAELHKGERIFIGLAHPTVVAESRQIWHTGTFEGLAHPGVVVFETRVVQAGFIGRAHPTVTVYLRKGQMITCIVGPATPPPGRPPNYVF
jgi:hypothetical protein